jgi:hypothetical protein
VDLERGPFSLVSTTEDLLGRKSSGFGLEIREYGRRDPSRWPRRTLYLQKLALTSLSWLCSGPTTHSAGNRTRDLWICSQELWPQRRSSFDIKWIKIWLIWRIVFLFACNVCKQHQVNETRATFIPALTGVMLKYWA